MLPQAMLALCLAAVVADQDDAGRRAVQLCRGGNEAGLAVLRDIAARQAGQAWAAANLGLGLRLVGRYDEARAVYADMLQRHGRQAWILNDLALVEQARADFDSALRLYLEGTRPPASADVDAADTCRTNAAILLIARRGPNDSVKAEALLRVVVARDPSRVRSAWWLTRVNPR
jgi:hypothetical protein